MIKLVIPILILFISVSLLSFSHTNYNVKNNLLVQGHLVTQPLEYDYDIITNASGFNILNPILTEDVINSLSPENICGDPVSPFEEIPDLDELYGSFTNDSEFRNGKIYVLYFGAYWDIPDIIAETNPGFTLKKDYFKYINSQSYAAVTRSVSDKYGQIFLPSAFVSYNEAAKNHILFHELMHFVGGLGHSWSNECIISLTKLMYFAYNNASKGILTEDEKLGIFSRFTPAELILENDEDTRINLLRGRNKVNIKVKENYKDYPIQLYVDRIPPNQLATQLDLPNDFGQLTKDDVLIKNSSPSYTGDSKYYNPPFPSPSLFFMLDNSKDVEFEFIWDSSNMSKWEEWNFYLKAYGLLSEDNPRNRQMFNSQYTFYKDEPMFNNNINLHYLSIDNKTIAESNDGDMWKLSFVPTALLIRKMDNGVITDFLPYYFDDESKDFNESVKSVKYEIYRVKFGEKLDDNATPIETKEYNWSERKDLHYTKEDYVSVTEDSHYRVKMYFYSKEKEERSDDDLIVETVKTLTESRLLKPKNNEDGKSVTKGVIKLNNFEVKIETNDIELYTSSPPIYYDKKDYLPESMVLGYAKKEDDVENKDLNFKDIPGTHTPGIFEATLDFKDDEADDYIFRTTTTYNIDGEIQENKSYKNVNITRKITLGTISTVFKDPRNYVEPDAKTIVGNIDPLDELDTIRVSVPLAIDPGKWGDVELLRNGEKVANDTIYKPLNEPWFKDIDSTQTRVYKFVWNYLDEPEGFVTFRARFVEDTLSWSQRKIKVAYAETWEDFDNVAPGGLPPGWETLTQYAYPPENGPALHYWRTAKNADATDPSGIDIYDVEGMMDSLFTSNDLRTSTASFTSQRFEILSPVIEVPPAADDVQTFLTFDYARELETFDYNNSGRSLMVIQVCDSAGNMIDQFYGAMDTSELVEGSHFPIDGSYLNMPNFFWYNPMGLYGDNIWNEYTFWLNFGSSVGHPEYHDYSGQKIRLKFIQYFNNNFVGIIDNWNPLTGTPLTSPGSTTFAPPNYTALTKHHFDNFLVKTFLDINLPPTMKTVPDQEVIQHCGWQELKFTDITDGQGAILEDYEDLETQGKSSFLDNIVSIKDVEQKDNGALLITALVRDEKEFKEVSFNPNAFKNDSKFLPQKVITLEITSDNEGLLPLDSLKYEYIPGATEMILKYKPVDTENGEVELTVSLKDDGGLEYNGKDSTQMKFKINVIPFNAPEYDPPMDDKLSITEDFTEFSINLGDHFKDDEGDEIFYTIDADTSLVDITLGGDVLKGKGVSVLNVKSKENVFGTGILTIMADDKSGAIPTVITVNIDIQDDGNDFEFDEEYIYTNDYNIPVINLPVNFEPDSVDLSTMFNSEITTGFTYTITLDNDTTLNAATTDHYIELTSIPDSAGVALGTINIGFGGSSFETKIKFVVGNFSPEIIAPIPDITTDPNFAPIYINLKEHYSDPNKDWLGYSVRSGQDKIEPYISFYDDQLVIESKPNIGGLDTLYLSIYDGEFTIYDSLIVTIGEVTDPVDHLVTPIEDQHVSEDFGTKTIDLNEHFADPADNGINYVVSYDNTKVTCEIVDGHLLVVHSIANFHGYAPIMVAIDDGSKEIPEGKFEGCDPKNVITIKEKIKR